MIYMPNFVESSSLTATDIFVILLSGGGFKCDRETKFKQSLCKVSSEAAAADVFQNRCS